jgi:glucose-6-phosphate isomerase
MPDAFTHDVAGCFADAVGEGGLSRDSYARWLATTQTALDRLRAARDSGERPFLTLPERRDDMADAVALAERYRESFDDVLILGTGGSSLGGRAIAAFAPWGAKPRVHVLENVDPDGVDGLLAGLAPARTGVLAISKSGGTAETLCQMAVVLDWLRAALGESELARHAAVMTEPSANPLAGIAGRFRLPRLAHDPELGGRFSVLSTGVVPAVLAGLEPADLRAGAADVTRRALAPEAELDTVAPAVGAAVQIGLRAERMVTQSVLMPYSDRLAPFARWFRQLWAESLGKAGGGTTPIDALGAVDQHSQLQLYLGGPGDKVYTLIRRPTAGTGRRVAADIVGDPALGYLHGRTMGDLLDAEALATAESLMAAGRPVRWIDLPKLDTYTLGALLQHVMLETAIAADLMGVNAYDQPAVEDGKRRAVAKLRAMGGDETTEGR